MESIDRFAAAMRALWREEPSAPVRWQRVKALMPILLEDRELCEAAARWQDTNGDGYHTVKNLLLYEDPQDGFVINALVKAEGGTAVPHDHAHTWTAYGVIEGHERVVHYDLVEGDRDGERAVLRVREEIEIGPGYVDVIGPYEAHCEIAEAGRTVAVIVRSQRPGVALHAVFDLATGAVTHRVGPDQVALTL